MYSVILLILLEQKCASYEVVVFKKCGQGTVDQKLDPCNSVLLFQNNISDWIQRFVFFFFLIVYKSFLHAGSQSACFLHHPAWFPSNALTLCLWTIGVWSIPSGVWRGVGQPPCSVPLWPRATQSRFCVWMLQMSCCLLDLKVDTTRHETLALSFTDKTFAISKHSASAEVDLSDSHISQMNR